MGSFRAILVFAIVWGLAPAALGRSHAADDENPILKGREQFFEDGEIAELNELERAALADPEKEEERDRRYMSILKDKILSPKPLTEKARSVFRELVQDRGSHSGELSKQVAELLDGAPAEPRPESIRKEEPPPEKNSKAALGPRDQLLEILRSKSPFELRMDERFQQFSDVLGVPPSGITARSKPDEVKLKADSLRKEQEETLARRLHEGLTPREEQEYDDRDKEILFLNNLQAHWSARPAIEPYEKFLGGVADGLRAHAGRAADSVWRGLKDSGAGVEKFFRNLELPTRKEEEPFPTLDVVGQQLASLEAAGQAAHDPQTAKELFERLSELRPWIDFQPELVPRRLELEAALALKMQRPAREPETPDKSEEPKPQQEKPAPFVAQPKPPASEPSFPNPAPLAPPTVRESAPAPAAPLAQQWRANGGRTHVWNGTELPSVVAGQRWPLPLPNGAPVVLETRYANGRVEYRLATYFAHGDGSGHFVTSALSVAQAPGLPLARFASPVPVSARPVGARWCRRCSGLFRR